MRPPTLAAVTAASLAGSLIQPTSAASVNGTSVTDPQLSAANLSQPDQHGIFERKGNGRGRRTTSIAATTTSISKASTTTKTTTTAQPTNTGKPQVETAIDLWYEAANANGTRTCDPDEPFRSEAQSIIGNRTQAGLDPAGWASSLCGSISKLKDHLCPNATSPHTLAQQEAFNHTTKGLQKKDPAIIWQAASILETKVMTDNQTSGGSMIDLVSLTGLVAAGLVAAEFL